MILKINIDKETGLILNDCWIFGEIERIHYTTHIAGKSFKQEFYDLVLNNNGKINSEKDVLQISLRFSDLKRDIYNILLQDCKCYLCNNDGKTIDKLVC